MTDTNQLPLDLSTEGLSASPKTKKSLAKWIDFIVDLWKQGHRIALEVEGEAGYAKTSSVKAHLRKKGIKPVVISLAQVDWDTFFAPYPEQGEDSAERRVKILLHADLLDPNPKVLVFDESRRAGKREKNILLEIKTSGTIAGVAIPNLVGVICLDNPGGTAEYAGIAGDDPAQGDRGFHVKVEVYDIDWKSWFEETFPGLPWAEVWKWHARLDTSERRVMMPRNLEHMTRLGLAGFPIILGLPILASGREKVINARGEDTTERTLDGLAKALGVPNLPESATDVVKLVDWCVMEGQNVRVIGPHGRGKTAYIAARIHELSDQFQARHNEPLAFETFSAPLVSPQDLALLAPGGNGELRHIIAERFTLPNRRFVLCIDEMSRADRRIAAANMALVQEGEIAGQRLEGLQCVIALDNPVEYKGLRYDAGRIDRAQASRFTATVTIDDNALPWKEWFSKTFGDAAQPVIDWWYEDLDDAGKGQVSMRALVRLVLAHQAGMPLKAALPKIGHSQVDVPLVDLEKRLANAEVIGFSKIVAEVEDYVGRIAAGDEDLAVAVKAALATADPAQLRKQIEVCKRYIKVLPNDLASALVRTKEAERQAFWAEVIVARLEK
jgi:hypothetical protein